ncbi:hypothetical protein FQZ97_967660 [compost metagenome]
MPRSAAAAIGSCATVVTFCRKAGAADSEDSTCATSCTDTERARKLFTYSRLRAASRYRPCGALLALISPRTERL